MGEAVQQVTESSFFKRYSSLDDQVGPILFLASDEAAYITGAVLPVAGGDNG
ncbi:1,6-dihydroxycyclohexa-2,4-diene-1-carboxylate dehydrogenase [compost metagenome]